MLLTVILVKHVYYMDDELMTILFSVAIQRFSLRILAYRSGRILHLF